MFSQSKILFSAKSQFRKHQCSQPFRQTAGDGMPSEILLGRTGLLHNYPARPSITMTEGLPMSARDGTLIIPGRHPQSLAVIGWPLFILRLNLMEYEECVIKDVNRCIYTEFVKNCMDGADGK